MSEEIEKPKNKKPLVKFYEGIVIKEFEFKNKNYKPKTTFKTKSKESFEYLLTTKRISK